MKNVQDRTHTHTHELFSFENEDNWKDMCTTRLRPDSNVYEGC